jgi:protein associated with RNAse G/E
MKHAYETLETYYCNMTLKTIATYTTSLIYFATSIWFNCNILLTIKTYYCNIGERENLA